MGAYSVPLLKETLVNVSIHTHTYAHTHTHTKCFDNNEGIFSSKPEVFLSVSFKT